MTARSANRKKAKAAKPKKRKQRTVENDETCLHMHCQQWLEESGFGTLLLIFHVANERWAPVQYLVKLRKLGLMPGVADYLAFPLGGRRIAIELKDDEGVQSKAQAEFQKRWENSQGVYYIVRTVEEFQNIVMAAAIFAQPALSSRANTAEKT